MYVQEQWPNIDWYRYLCIWERLPEDMRHVSDTLGVRESFLAQAVQGILPERQASQRQTLHFHRRFFTALALHDLVHEVPILHVARRYGATKGLLQTLQSAAGTFAGMVTVFCSRLGWTNLELLLSQFQSRLTFGVERALCDLVAISLLNGFRARVLYNAGYHTLAALATASPVTVETCLRNAVPFKSYKLSADEDGEVEEPVSRTWCARLRKGLTESEAAVLIVSEAKAILSKQLNVPVSVWGKGGPTGGSPPPNHLPTVQLSNSPLGITPGSNGTDPIRTRKRARESSSPRRATASDPISSPCVKRTHNNDNDSNHSIEPSSAPYLKSVPASTPCSKKKPKLPEGVLEESILNFSQVQLIEDSLNLSPIAVQTGSKVSEQATPECSIDPAMLFNGTLSFSLAELEPERVADKAPLTIPDSFQCTQGSFSFQTYAMIDAAYGVDGNGEVGEEEKGNVPQELSLSMIRLDDSSKRDPLTPSQLDIRLSQFIQETPLKSTSFHPSGLKELSSLGSSQVSQNGLTVIDVTSNQVLFDTFVCECMHQEAVAFSVATASVDRAEGIGSVIIKSVFSGIRILQYLNQQVVGVAFCWGGMDVYYVSLCGESADRGTDDDTSLCPSSSSVVSLDVRVAAVRRLFQESGWKKVIAYDMKKHAKLLALSCGVMPRPSASLDPVVASWMLDTDAREKTVHKMVLNYLPDQPLSGCEDYEEVPLSSVATNAADPEMQASAESVLAFVLSSKLESLLRAEDLHDAYIQLEMPSLLVLAKVELNGIGFSPEECGKQKDVLQCRLAELEQEAYNMAGHTFSLTSSEDIASVLYHELGLPSGSNATRKLRGQKGAGLVRRANASRVKHLSTAKDVLEKIKSHHPLPRLILEWRRISATLTKMVYPLMKCAITHEKGSSRVYPTVQIHTATGRVAFSEPSIQMVPKEFDIGDRASVSEKAPPLMSDSQYLEGEARGEVANTFNAAEARPSSVCMRNVFHAHPKGIFLAADYSQLELRILAQMSGDRKLKQFLNSDGDAFKMIAGEWLGLQPSAVSDQERQNAKQVCYGMIYGIGAKALGEQLGISDNDASQFMETFRSKYPTMKKYIAQVVENCREKGYVTTLLGRKRFLSGIGSANVHARSQAERQAVNTTIQGSAADLVKTAMVNIDARVERLYPASTCLLPSSVVTGEEPRAWLVLQLHDELIYEVLETDLHIVARILRQEMENALKLSVKFPVKLKAGHSWGNLESLSL